MTEVLELKKNYLLKNIFVLQDELQKRKVANQSIIEQLNKIECQMLTKLYNLDQTEDKEKLELEKNLTAIKQAMISEKLDFLNDSAKINEKIAELKLNNSFLLNQNDMS